VVGSPPPSRVSSEGGRWAYLERDGPLRLAFRGREGWGTI